MYLNNHSYYSLRYGTISEQDLLALAVQHGLETLVLTNINNTSGSLNFVRLAQRLDRKAVLGIDFRNGNTQVYVGIAKNNVGFQELNAFLSHHLQSKKPFPDHAPAFQHVQLVYPLERVMELEKVRFRESEHIGISTATIRKLPFTKYVKMTDKLVVLQTVTFRNKRDFNVHRLLRAIDLNILLSQLPADQQGSLDDVMLPPEQLYKAFELFPNILENTQRLLNDCSIYFNFTESHLTENKQLFHADAATDLKQLKALCAQGIVDRYGASNATIQARVEKEIDLVVRKNFVAYFLINWEICRYARQQGYFYVGRGSGANSLIAYLLHITEVDPIELDLYFERFINDYRTSPPDFDLDFSWDDREDITRYIFEHFDNVALLATYNTFQHRAVIRELGKVFGIPKIDIDKLTSGDIKGVQLGDMHKLVLKYASLIQGMPNYTSIHAGGILITERPIHYYSATTIPPKGFPTVQFDMHIAEDAGIHKFDILAQRGLGKIRDAIALIKENQPHAIMLDVRNDVHKFKTDPAINEMISQAQCIGCFYVESPAMRMLLSKLRTHDYLGLVAASSVIRPGVSQSGMMREYILRTRYPEKRKEAHPIMAQIMPETFGIMVYQEDVIKVAHYYAGLSLAEADVLRRGMSGKYRSRDEFKQVETNYFNNCLKKGHDPKESLEIWEQIKSFAGYAFAKGHSASYAVESYQSLYLKRYFPLEYMTATLNNGGGFYTPEIYVHEAKICGATIEAPCVNHSEYLNVIRGTTIYLALGYLKELEKRTIQRLIESRNFHGPFQSLDDFIDRVPISIEQLSILIRINAFRFTGIDRYELLWQAHFKLDKGKKPQMQERLFKIAHRAVALPKLQTTMQELAFEQIELLGFALCSPFDLLHEPLTNFNGKQEMEQCVGQQIELYGYLVNIKTTHTTLARKVMQFATFLDHRGAFVDVVIFPQVVSRVSFRGSGIYIIAGKVTTEFDFTSLEVTHLERAKTIVDPRYAEDNPQTIHQIDKQESLRDRRMGNARERYFK